MFIRRESRAKPKQSDLSNDTLQNFVTHSELSSRFYKKISCRYILSKIYYTLLLNYLQMNSRNRWQFFFGLNRYKNWMAREIFFFFFSLNDRIVIFIIMTKLNGLVSNSDVSVSRGFSRKVATRISVLSFCLPIS